MITGISTQCEVAKGVFASEYLIRIRMANGDYWEGVADKEMVFDLEREPIDDQYVRGRMYAYLITYDNFRALVELPIEDSTAGRRIFVPMPSVRKEQVPA